jgi:hypothetical protein
MQVLACERCVLSSAGLSQDADQERFDPAFGRLESLLFACPKRSNQQLSWRLASCYRHAVLESFVAQSRIEDDDELSHAGHDGDFGEFSSLSELLVMVLEFGLPSDSDQCGHVEGGADLWSATKDGASSPEGAAVAIEGSDADELGDLLPGERAEFRQQGHQGGLDDRAEPFDGSPCAGEMRFAESGDVLIEGEQFGLKGGDGTPGELLEHGEVETAELLGVLLDGEDDLCTPGDEGSEFALPRLRRDKGGELVTEAGCHVSEDAGIDGVGFGELALGAGEIPRLPGIDAGNGNAFSDERIEEGHLESAGGLNDDEGVIAQAKPLNELGDAGLGVVEALGESRVVSSEIEERLADIDTDTNHEGSPLKWKSREHSRRIPALSVRTIVGQLFGRRSEQPTCGAMLVNGHETERETGTHVGLSALTIAERQEIKRKATRLSRRHRCALPVPCATRH